MEKPRNEPRRSDAKCPRKNEGAIYQRLKKVTNRKSFWNEGQMVFYGFNSNRFGINNFGGITSLIAANLLELFWRCANFTIIKN